MSDAVKTSRCPMAFVERAKFVRQIDLSGGLHVMGLVEFEHEVHWLRESESQAFVLDAEDELLHGNLYNDFYGFLSSASEAVSDAVDYGRRFRSSAGTSIECVARVKVTEIPVVPVEGALDRLGFLSYRAIPNDWMRAGAIETDAWLRATTFGERMGLPSPYLRPRLRDDAVVWSSRDDEAEGKARMEKFLADATPGLSFEIAEAARVRLFRKAPADA